MSETASLVLKLDSTQVAKGSADLDKLSASAAKAERANAMLKMHEQGFVAATCGTKPN